MRILIIGASGSGTTTLGEALSSAYAYKAIDADNYYWLPTDPPFQQKRNRSQRLKMLVEDLQCCENAVVSGSIMNWGAELEDSFDLIVFLYLDAAIRVQRLKIREEARLGFADPTFLNWAAQYDNGPSEGRSLLRHNNWLSERACKVIRIVGDLSVSERIKIVEAALT